MLIYNQVIALLISREGNFSLRKSGSGTLIWSLNVLVDPSMFIWQRARFEEQIKQHNDKREALSLDTKSVEQNREDDDYSYEVSLDEDFLTSLEYGMPPASGMVCFRHVKVLRFSGSFIILLVSLLLRRWKSTKRNLCNCFFFFLACGSSSCVSTWYIVSLVLSHSLSRDFFSG